MKTAPLTSSLGLQGFVSDLNIKAKQLGNIPQVILEVLHANFGSVSVHTSLGETIFAVGRDHYSFHLGICSRNCKKIALHGTSPVNTLGVIHKRPSAKAPPIPEFASIDAKSQFNYVKSFQIEPMPQITHPIKDKGIPVHSIGLLVPLSNDELNLLRRENGWDVLETKQLISNSDPVKNLSPRSHSALHALTIRSKRLIDSDPSIRGSLL